MQLRTSTRNGILDYIETDWGTAPIVRFKTGAAPANVAAAASGTLLMEATLPSDYLAAASSGSKAQAGTWEGTGLANGEVGHYEIVASNGTTRLAQGTVSVTGGGGEMQLPSLTIAIGTTYPITSAAIAIGNA